MYKMKIIFILLAFLSLIGDNIGQSYFSKVFKPPFALTSFSNRNFLLQNDTVVVFLHCSEVKDSLLYENTYLSKFNSHGEFKRANFIGHQFVNERMIKDGNDIVIAGIHGEKIIDGKLYRSFDSIQIFKYEDNLPVEKLKVINFYPRQGKYLDLQFLEYNNQYVLYCSDEYDTTFRPIGEFKPYIYWINKDFTLDTIIQVDLPYGALFDYGIDKAGNLDIFANYHSGERVSGPASTTIKHYQGYIKLNKNKQIVHTFFYESEKKFTNYFADVPKGICYDDGTKVMTHIKIGTGGLSLIAFDDRDSVLWTRDSYRDQSLKHFSYARCLNDDIIIAGENGHSTRLSPHGINLQTSFIQRLDKNGNEKFYRSYGYYADDLSQTSCRFLDVKEASSNSIYAIGWLINGDNTIIPGFYNDSTWMVHVDSMGCIDKDKCNDVIAWNAPNNIYQYDQINVRHKEWYISNTAGRYSQYFGIDTNMFHRPEYGWLRYRPIMNKNLDTGVETKDTVFAIWTREGRMYISPRNFNPFGALPIYPLYDFTLKLHDTFTLPYGFGQAKVVQVDSISLIPGYLRKRITLQHLNPTNQAKYGDLVWIEGIGAPNGILYYKDWQEGTQTALTCYYDRGEKRYSSTNDPDCRKVVDTSSMLPIIDQNIMRFVVINSFTLPNNRMERWKFNFLATVKENAEAYYELLESEKEDGNDFIGSGRFFREEDNRVYQYISASAGERLLYDMNLKAGDSIRMDYADGPRLLVVTREDSIQIDDQKYRKRLTLQCVRDGELEFGDPAEWIEGIGRLYEPFIDFSHCSLWDVARPEVVCMYDGVAEIYKSETAPDDCWVKPLVIDTTDMDRSTVWYSSSSTGNILPNWDCELKIDITKVMRDTLIGNKLCRIIGVASGGQYYPESEIIEYSKDGKMYFYEDDEWKLLYDFTAQVGDTVSFHISEKYPYYFRYSIPAFYDSTVIKNNPYRLKIVKIDSVLSTNNKYLKSFFTEEVDVIHPIQMNVIIDKVGSKDKLFGFNTNFLPPDCFNDYPRLRCYSDDNTFIKFVEGECDKLTQTLDYLDTGFRYYPNPGSDILVIDFSSEVTFPLSYNITDISGRSVIVGSQNTGNFTINTSQLTPGMYIITIHDPKSKIWHRMWIKE